MGERPIANKYREGNRGAHDGVAFAANAAFLAAGYSLCAVGPAALTDPPPTGALRPQPLDLGLCIWGVDFAVKSPECVDMGRYFLHTLILAL